MKHPLVENIEKNHYGHSLILLDTKSFSEKLTARLAADIPFSVATWMQAPVDEVYGVTVTAYRGRYNAEFSAEMLMDIGEVEMLRLVAEELALEIANLTLDAHTRQALICPYILCEAKADNDTRTVYFEYRVGEVNRTQVIQAMAQSLVGK